MWWRDMENPMIGGGFGSKQCKSEMASLPFARLLRCLLVQSIGCFLFGSAVIEIVPKLWRSLRTPAVLDIFVIEICDKTLHRRVPWLMDAMQLPKVLGQEFMQCVCRNLKASVLKLGRTHEALSRRPSGSSTPKAPMSSCMSTAAQMPRNGTGVTCDPTYRSLATLHP